MPAFVVTRHTHGRKRNRTKAEETLEDQISTALELGKLKLYLYIHQ